MRAGSGPSGDIENASAVKIAVRRVAKPICAFVFLPGCRKLERVRSMSAHHKQKLKRNSLAFEKIAWIRDGQVSKRYCHGSADSLANT